MRVNYLETTFKVFDIDHNLVSSQVTDGVELTPEQDKILLNKKTGKKYNTCHVLSKDDCLEDYIEVEAK